MYFRDGDLLPENQEPLIITAAPYGPAWRPDDYPGEIPVSWDEQVQAAVDCYEAGASLLHIHVRDPKTGKISKNFQEYADQIGRLREAVPDMVLQVGGSISFAARRRRDRQVAVVRHPAHAGRDRPEAGSGHGGDRDIAVRHHLDADDGRRCRYAYGRRAGDLEERIRAGEQQADGDEADDCRPRARDAEHRHWQHTNGQEQPETGLPGEHQHCARCCAQCAAGGFGPLPHKSRCSCGRLHCTSIGVRQIASAVGKVQVPSRISGCG